MLIEFSVSNFLSFRDRQTLSMVASSGQEKRTSHCFKSTINGTPDLLRSAVIHGPNAAGKSNLLTAMSVMKTLIIGPLGGHHSKLIVPFQLNKQHRERPCEFEVIFLKEGVRYQYGFSLDQERIHEEWLIAHPLGRPQTWFHRCYDTDTHEYQWSFSDKFKGQKSVYKTATRPESLLLSTAIQLNNQQLQAPYTWIRETWRMMDQTRAYYPRTTMDRCALAEDKLRIISFLNAADLSVLDLEVRGVQMEFAEDTPENLRKMFPREVVLTHGKGDNSFELPLREDSQGTNKLFPLIGPLLDVLDEDGVLIVDELSNSLHPLLLQSLVAEFHKGKGAAQLIFTNHEATLLDLELFRRDQIWFVEKNEDLASNLFPLTDYHPRKAEAIGKGYLQGRYGALPFLKEVGDV